MGLHQNRQESPMGGEAVPQTEHLLNGERANGIAQAGAEPGLPTQPRGAGLHHEAGHGGGAAAQMQEPLARLRWPRQGHLGPVGQGAHPDGVPQLCGQRLLLRRDGVLGNTGQTHHQTQVTLQNIPATQASCHGRTPPVHPLRGETGAQQPLAELAHGLPSATKEQVPPSGGHGVGAQGQTGQQRQGAPGTTEQPHEVIAGHVLHHTPPRLGRHPVSTHKAHPDELIPDAQIAMAQTSGETTGHQSANSARAGGWRRVHRQPLPLFRQGGLQPAQGQSRFHLDGEIFHAVAEDSVAGGKGDNPAAPRHRLTPVQMSPQSGRAPGLTGPMKLTQKIGNFLQRGPQPPTGDCGCSRLASQRQRPRYQ